MSLEQQVEIQAGAHIVLRYRVKEGDKFSWSFFTAGYDVEFEVAFHSAKEISVDEAVDRAGSGEAGAAWEEDEGGEVLVESTRVTAVEGEPHEGEVEAPSKGEIRIVLDNSYSMFRGKTVSLRAAVNGEPCLDLDAQREDSAADAESSAHVEELRKLVFTDGLGDDERKELEAFLFTGSRQTDSLKRFLALNSGSPAKAAAAIQHTLQWRREMDVTNILRRPLDPAKIEVIRRHFPHGVFGRDKEGFPVVCMRQGKMDAEAIKAVCSAEDMEHFWVQQNEYFATVLLPRVSEEAGRPVNRLTFVHDLDGLGRSHLTRSAFDVLRMIARVDQSYYPGFVRRVIVVNAPWVFSAVWRFISPYLNQAVKDQYTILGSQDDTTAELQKVIAPDQLVPELGGTGDAGGLPCITSGDSVDTPHARAFDACTRGE